MNYAYDRSFAPYVLPRGIPLGLDALPDARWAGLMIRSQFRGLAAGGLGQLRRRLTPSMRQTRPGRGIEALFRRIVPEAAGRLPTTGDAEFAYQRFAGVNPLTIARVREMAEIPGRLRLDDDLCARILGEGQRLADRVARGDIFIQRYDSLRIRSEEDLQPGKFVAAGTVLFCYAPEMDAAFPVAPIAIECPIHRADGATEVFTPLDGERWRAARRVLDVADVHQAELCLHLARTHSMLVPFAMAMRRILPPSHPLYELLLPHLRFNLFVDFLAWRQGVRDTTGILIRSLAGNAGWSQDVAASLHHDFSFRDLRFETDLATRGLDDHPVDYPYRDDGRLLWAALHRFFDGYVRLTWATDAALQSDAPVHAFLADAASPEGGNVRELLAGARLETREELVQILTEIVFVAGPLHALAHYSLTAHLQDVDENPAFLTGNPLNATDGGAPGYERGMNQFTRVYGTNCQYDTLGDYSRFSLGVRPELQPGIASFQEELRGVERTITDRNQQRFAPFIHFLPSRISNGVTV